MNYSLPKKRILGCKITLTMKLFFSICALSLMSLGLSAQIEFFQGTFEEAKAKAAQEDKLIFVDAYTSWCGPCKWMDKNTFTDANVAAYYNENFINVKINMEKGEGPTLARKYRVMAYPTLLYVKGNGDVAHRALGAKGADDFLKVGKDASAKL